MTPSLTLLPSKKTRAEWCLDLLMIAQGNSVIELTPQQAAELYKFIGTTLSPAIYLQGDPKDLGM